ncbi:MAG: hypothetical protein M1829_002051 [Trizodia sp. TS-e1964]|nr:MAG: hypothetical protein M1829_002051 [Trizodia sp. TS-e1964]
MSSPAFVFSSADLIEESSAPPTPDMSALLLNEVPAAVSTTTVQESNFVDQAVNGMQESPGPRRFSPELIRRLINNSSEERGLQAIEPIMPNRRSIRTTPRLNSTQNAIGSEDQPSYMRPTSSSRRFGRGNRFPVVPNSPNSPGSQNITQPLDINLPNTTRRPRSPSSPRFTLPSGRSAQNIPQLDGSTTIRGNSIRRPLRASRTNTPLSPVAPVTPVVARTQATPPSTYSHASTSTALSSGPALNQRLAREVHARYEIPGQPEPVRNRAIRRPRSPPAPPLFGPHAPPLFGAWGAGDFPMDSVFVGDSGIRHAAHSNLDNDKDGRPAPLEDEEMNINLGCKICFSQIADTLILPCAHLCMCLVSSKLAWHTF